MFLESENLLKPTSGNLIKEYHSVDFNVIKKIHEFISFINLRGKGKYTIAAYYLIFDSNHELEAVRFLFTFKNKGGWSIARFFKERETYFYLSEKDFLSFAWYKRFPYPFSEEKYIHDIDFDRFLGDYKETRKILKIAKIILKR